MVDIDQAGTVLQEESLKDRHSRGDNGHSRKAAMEYGTKTKEQLRLRKERTTSNGIRGHSRRQQL
jgi:hypothetical protein